MRMQRSCTVHACVQMHVHWWFLGRFTRAERASSSADLTQPKTEDRGEFCLVFELSCSKCCNATRAAGLGTKLVAWKSVVEFN